MKLLLLFLLTFILSSGLATEWNCRNQDLEISCHSGHCQVSDSFTPLDVILNDLSGELSVGMYSGIWEGRGEIIRQKDYLFITAKTMKFSTSDEYKDFVMILDNKDHVALFKGAGFAMPMSCTKRTR